MSPDRVRKKPYQKIRHPVDDPEQTELYDFEDDLRYVADPRPSSSSDAGSP